MASEQVNEDLYNVIYDELLKHLENVAGWSKLRDVATAVQRRVLEKIEAYAQPTTPEESSEAVSDQPPAGESPSAQAFPPPLAEDLGREGARIIEAATKLRDALAEWAHEGRMEKMSNELRGEGPESELEAARNQRDFYKAMIEATTKERDQLAAAFEPLKAKIFEVEGQRNRLSHDNDLLRKQIGTLRDKVDKAEKERHLSRATVAHIRRLLQQRPNA